MRGGRRVQSRCFFFFFPEMFFLTWTVAGAQPQGRLIPWVPGRDSGEAMPRYRSQSGLIAGTRGYVLSEGIPSEVSRSGFLSLCGSANLHTLSVEDVQQYCGVWWPTWRFSLLEKNWANTLHKKSSKFSWHQPVLVAWTPLCVDIICLCLPCFFTCSWSLCTVHKTSLARTALR